MSFGHHVQLDSRRKFLTCTAAVAAGSALFPSTARSQSSNTSSSGKALSGPIHGTYLQVALNHLHKLAVNPNHNPFATGDLAMAYRLHAEDLESTGMHRRIKADLLSNGVAPIHQGANVDSAFNTISKFGINFSPERIAGVRSSLLEASAFAAPRMEDALRTNDLIKVQRGIHGAMLEQQAVSMNKATASLSRHKDTGTDQSRACNMRRIERTRRVYAR